MDNDCSYVGSFSQTETAGSLSEYPLLIMGIVCYGAECSLFFPEQELTINILLIHLQVSAIVNQI